MFFEHGRFTDLGMGGGGSDRYLIAAVLNLTKLLNLGNIQQVTGPHLPPSKAEDEVGSSRDDLGFRTIFRKKAAGLKAV